MKYFFIKLVILSTSTLYSQSDLIIESGAVFYVYQDSQIGSDFITVNAGGGFYADDPSCVADGTTIQGDGDVNLPVELTSFTAKLNGAEVILEWITATEVNNYGFEIERTNKEIDWQKIGFVEGHGNSNSHKQYSFTDDNLVGGNVFQYRLKQIDNDGQFEYSNTVEVKVIPTKFALYQNFPNPFNPTTKIKYQLDEKSKVVITVYDVLGGVVIQLLNEKKEAGVYEVEFVADNIPSGTYIYRIVSENFIDTKKMILMK